MVISLSPNSFAKLFEVCRYPVASNGMPTLCNCVSVHCLACASALSLPFHHSLSWIQGKAKQIIHSQLVPECCACGAALMLEDPLFVYPLINVPVWTRQLTFFVIGLVRRCYWPLRPEHATSLLLFFFLVTLYWPYLSPFCSLACSLAEELEEFRTARGCRFEPLGTVKRPPPRVSVANAYT